jgi:hypothetical protein
MARTPPPTPPPLADEFDSIHRALIDELLTAEGFCRTTIAVIATLSFPTPERRDAMRAVN